MYADIIFSIIVFLIVEIQDQYKWGEHLLKTSSRGFVFIKKTLTHLLLKGKQRIIICQVLIIMLILSYMFALFYLK